MISDESDSNDPNSDSYEESIVSKQDAEGNMDADDAAEIINDDYSVTSISKEE